MTINPAAIHEAAHAVAAYRFGLVFVAITLKPPRCQWQPGTRNPKTRRQLWAHIVQTMVGEEAEVMLARTYEPEKYGADRAAVRNMVDALVEEEDGGNAYLLLARFKAAAVKFVRQHKEEILAVADALVKSRRGRLTMGHVEQVLEGLRHEKRVTA